MKSLGMARLLNELKKDAKLGLWEVPHATLSLMAGLGRARLKVKKNGEVKDEGAGEFWLRAFGDDMKSHLEKSVDLLCKEENLNKWKILEGNDLPDLALEEENDVGIALGVGSWALKFNDIWREKSKIKADIRLLAPEEGVLAFMDCAAILTGKKGDVAPRVPAELMNHWLKEPVQQTLATVNSSVRACPVTKESITALLKDHGDENPCSETLQRFVDGELHMQLRPTPKDFERPLWNRLVKTHKEFKASQVGPAHQ